MLANPQKTDRQNPLKAFAREQSKLLLDAWESSFAEALEVAPGHNGYRQSVEAFLIGREATVIFEEIPALAMVNLAVACRVLREVVYELWRESGQTIDIDNWVSFCRDLDHFLENSLEAWSQRIRDWHEILSRALNHDLINLHGAGMMGAGYLTLALPAESEAYQVAGKILAGGEKLTRMVRDLADASLFSMARPMHVTENSVDLWRTCQGVVEDISVKVPAASIDLGEPVEVYVLADVARLKQVLSILLDNAVQHGDGDQPVIVEFVEEDAVVVVSVRNSGPTFAPEFAATLFDPHARFRYLEANGLPIPRVGLGLAMANLLASAMQGSVEYQPSDEAVVFVLRLRRS